MGGLIDISRKYTFKTIIDFNGELDLGFKSGIFFGNCSSDYYNIVCAILQLNNNGTILAPHSSFSFFNESDSSISVYKKQNNGNWFMKNNYGKVNIRYSFIILE